MKIYRIYIALLLFLSASCTDDRDSMGQDNRSYRVTASIEDDDAVTRVTDNGVRTSFAKNDAIHIGWSGGASYKFLYSGADNVFAPDDTDKDRSLWSDMLKAGGSTLDVYAWYGTMNNSLPAEGTTVSIPQDQTSESKLLSAICMAAHQSSVSTSAYTLNLNFQHLMARLALSVDIVDETVSQLDMMGATAQINNIYAEGTIAKGSGDDYKLNAANDQSGTQSIRMKQSWSPQQVFHLDFECLLPPQTLGEGQSITITLANGKEYVCSISSEVTLAAGKKTTLTASLKADANADFKPKITMIPDAANSAYSGNRLICCIKIPTSEEYRYRVYDKHPDGSWGEGELVYEDEDGTTEFPTNRYSNIAKTAGGIDIFGDYAVISTSLNNNSTYFIKKSKRTGKWYCSDGEIQGHGYSVCISNDFLVSGNHVNEHGDVSNRSYIYPIDENGNLGEVQDTPESISAYKCSIYGNVLATNSGVYEYDTNAGKWVKLFGYSKGQFQRVATDGKRVIMQEGEALSFVHIYNVATKKEEDWEGTKAQAGVSKPIAIYEDYALAGTDNKIDICYRDQTTGKWRILNPDGGFLEMIKHWDSSITLAKIDGTNISMKGTRAMIVDKNSSTSFFIENIDKMVEDYLKGPY